MDSCSTLLGEYVENKDPEVFKKIVERYQGLVYSACLRVTGNTHEAEDATQECFFAFVRNASTINTSLSGWFHTTAINCSKKLIRKSVRQRRHETHAVQQKESSTKEASWHEISPLIDEALAELPEQWRVPLIRHYMQSIPQAEIAHELQLDQSSVSRRINKGVEELRRIMNRNGILLSVSAIVLFMTEQAGAVEVPVGLTASLGKIALAGISSTGASSTGSAVTAAGSSGILATAKAKLIVASIALAVSIVTLHVISDDKDANKEHTAANTESHLSITPDSATKETPHMENQKEGTHMESPKTSGNKGDLATADNCDKGKYVYCMFDELKKDGQSLSHTDVLGFSGAAFRIHSLPRYIVCPSTVSARYGYKPEKIGREDFDFKKALATASMLIKPGRFGEYLSGQIAYKKWIELLEADENSAFFQYQSKANQEDGIGVMNAYCLASLKHARKSAAPFLRKYATQLPQRAAVEIEQAATCYDNVYQTLSKIGHPQWTASGRLSQAESMKQAMAFEAQAGVHIDNALEQLHQAAVERKEDRALIAGVPKIQFSNFQFNLFSSCLAACMKVLGENCPYEKICFYAGSAFRLRWDPHKWDLGNIDMQFIATDYLKPVSRAFAVTGYDWDVLLKPDYAVKNSAGKGVDDKKLWRKKIVQSINRGYPVIALGVIGPTEPCIIAGYDKNGEVLMGWNLFQDDHKDDPEVSFEPNGYFRKTNWYKDISGLYIIGKKVADIEAENHYLDAIKWACVVASEDGVQGKLGNPLAYKAWAEALCDDKSFDVNKPEKLKEMLMTSYDAMCMVYGRTHVGDLLKEIAKSGQAPNRELELAAAAYEEELKILRDMHRPFGGYLDPGDAKKVLKFADPRARRELAEMIVTAGQIDEQAVYHMREGLAKMRETQMDKNSGIVRIKGIESFSVGEYPSSPDGNIMRIEHFLGGGKDYADLICYSGFAFRTGWSESGCPSAGHPACGFFCRDKQKEVSDWKQTSLIVHKMLKENPDDKSAIMAKVKTAVKESIDRGIPVHYELDEDGMIIGYRDNGEKWLCLHPYYKEGKEAFWYDQGDNFIGGKDPYVIHIWQSPKSPEDRADTNELTIKALKRAVVMWNTEKSGDYFCGKAAYVNWLKWLESVNANNLEQAKSGMQGNAWCMFVLVHSRRIAAKWLRKKAATMKNTQAGELLKKAAEQYEMIPPICLEGYKTTWDFACGPQHIQFWTDQKRAHQIESLKEAMLSDENAVGYIKQALEKMDVIPD